MAGSRTPDNEASSDVAACGEITKPLRRFRCESIGFDREVLLAFSHRGRQDAVARQRRPLSIRQRCEQVIGVSLEGSNFGSPQKCYDQNVIIFFPKGAGASTGGVTV
jgi:hypothetical protein